MNLHNWMLGKLDSENREDLREKRGRSPLNP
jgi:hypothetical protein